MQSSSGLNKKVKYSILSHVIGSLSLLSFVWMSYISRRYFQELYLFDWTRHQNYWYIWVLIFYFTGAKKNVMSVSVALGNIFGVFLGQVIGEFELSLRESQITADMTGGQLYYYSSHRSWFIWLIIVFAFLIVGGLIQHGTIKPKCPKWMKRGLIRVKEWWLHIYNA